MAKFSRDKGQRGEREIIALLQPIVDKVYKNCEIVPQLKRNTLQSDRGGCDIAGLDWIALEIKFCETFALASWWQQCVQQAQGRMPVLIYRRTHQPWHVKMPGTLGDLYKYPAAVTVDIDVFLRWFEFAARLRLPK